MKTYFSPVTLSFFRHPRMLLSGIQQLYHFVTGQAVLVHYAQQSFAGSSTLPAGPDSRRGNDEKSTKYSFSSSS